VPPHSTSVPEDDPLRCGALHFWRNFASSNEAECRAALKVLGNLRGENYDGKFYESLSSPDSSSKFVKVDLPATSP
jgi:hypothetical protein